MKIKILALLVCLIYSGLSTAETLRVLNWSDYVDEELLNTFAQSRGIDIDYQLFDNEDEFIEMFFSGDEAWDVIVPSDTLLAFLISRKLVTPISPQSITEFDNLDPKVMDQLKAKDPGNQYSIPYLWGTTGIGINASVAPANSKELVAQHGWGVVFESQYRSLFRECGIAALYERDQIFASALSYLGYSVNTTNEAELAEAAEIMTGLAADVKYLHSFRYIEDLGSGAVCLAIGYSGDIISAGFEAEEEGTVTYHIPSQGATIWFDVFAIPANSKNKKRALEFINYFTNAQNSATNSNYNAYPTPLLSSLEFIDKEILEDPGIYPTVETMKHLEALDIATKKTRRLRKKYWVKATCAGSGLCEVPIDIVGY
jgi:putrescine transport system substrate-binding protein